MFQVRRQSQQSSPTISMDKHCLLIAQDIIHRLVTIVLFAEKFKNYIKNFKRISHIDVEQLQDIPTEIQMFLFSHIDLRVKENFL